MILRARRPRAGSLRITSRPTSQLNGARPPPICRSERLNSQAAEVGMNGLPAMASTMAWKIGRFLHAVQKTDGFALLAATSTWD
jgi:hypothetical protein